MAYGITNEKQIIDQSGINKQLKLLEDIASSWKVVASDLQVATLDFNAEDMSIDGKTPVETFEELMERMYRYVGNLEEYVEAVRYNVNTIKVEQELELATYKAEQAKGKSELEGMKVSGDLSGGSVNNNSSGNTTVAC